MSARAAGLALAILALALPLAQASPLAAGKVLAQAVAAEATLGPLEDTVEPFLEEPAEGSSCLADAGSLFCALAVSDVTLACTVTATAFSCDVTAAHEAAGSTATGLGGELLVPSHLEVGVCNGPGFCDVTTSAVASPCSWADGGHGCGTSGSQAITVSGTRAGCLYVWVAQDLSAHARIPGLGLDLAQDQAGDLEEFTAC